MITELREMSYMTGEPRLGVEVILQAYSDAVSPEDSYERRSARNFLCGFPSYYKERLELFADMCGASAQDIMYEARKLWHKELLKGWKWKT